MVGIAVALDGVSAMSAGEILDTFLEFFIAHFMDTDVACCISRVPESAVHCRVNPHMRVPVAALVGTLSDPSFPRAIELVPVPDCKNTSHGADWLVPTEDHETVMGFPRMTSRGSAMMLATACTVSDTFVLD